MIKDLNLFVRKLSLKTIHHKHDSNKTGLNSLMQLSVAECPDLRDLLLDETNTSSLTATLPSSPTPLLEAAERFLSPSGQGMDFLPSPVQEVTDPLLPTITDLRAKSHVFPVSSTNKSAQIFLKLVSKEIEALPPPALQSKNLTIEQQQALARLKTYTHLVIKEADKGGQVVVMDVNQYKIMCKNILNKH